MSKKKKVNPNRIPVTRADLKRAKDEATNAAIEAAWAILFTVLRDKEGYDVDGLKRVWQEVDDLSDSIAQGYVNVADLKDALKQEIGARLA